MKRNTHLIAWLSIALFVSFPLDSIVVIIVGMAHTTAFDYFFEFISNFWMIVFLYLTAMWVLYKHQKEWIPVIWVGFFFSLISSYMLKFWFARERMFPGTIPLLNLPDYSFPSSHTAAAFCIFPIICHVKPSLRLPYLLLIALIGLSRVYVNAHFLSDVIGGALLGLAIGQLIYHLEKKYNIFVS